MVLKAYRRFMIYCGQHQRGKSAMSKKSSICTENVGDAAVSREALCDFGGIFESAFSVYKTLSLFPFKELYNIYPIMCTFFQKKRVLRRLVFPYVVLCCCFFRFTIRFDARGLRSSRLLLFVDFTLNCFCDYI